MNKKVLIACGVIILAVAVLIVYRVLNSKSLSPSQTTVYQYKGTDVKVVYCRPSKRGRLIFGDSTKSALVPNGKYWRLGANESTEITFSKDVTFGGKPVKAGSYRIYAVPGVSTWQVSLNSELGQWGYDEPHHDLDVLSVEVPVDKTGTVTEIFTISFNENSSDLSMDLNWDTTHVGIPIAVQ